MPDSPETTNLRPATRQDAPHLARLIDAAGEGMPLWWWRRLTPPGGDPWEIGRQGAERDYGGFSWRNAVMAELGGAVAGCLIAYSLDDEPTPIEDDTPPVAVPLLELQNLAPGSFYLNVLAVYPQWRRRGVGARLLAEADHLASERRLSLIVSDANAGARRLYGRAGYRVEASRLKVKLDWDGPGETWLLMVKRPGLEA